MLNITDLKLLRVNLNLPIIVGDGITINVVKLFDTISGGIFELITNKTNSEPGYLTLAEVVTTIENLKKVNT